MSWMMRQSSRASPGQVDRLVDLDDAALDLRDGPLVLFVKAAGQDDIGVPRRIVQEEVDGGEELELVQAAGDEACCPAARPSD